MRLRTTAALSVDKRAQPQQTWLRVSGRVSLAGIRCHDDGCWIRLHADVMNVLGGPKRAAESGLVTLTGLVSRGTADVSMIFWTYQLQLVLPLFVFQPVNNDWRWSQVNSHPSTTPLYLFGIFFSSPPPPYPHQTDPGHAIYSGIINICRRIHTVKMDASCWMECRDI